MNPKQNTPNLIAWLRSQAWTAALIWSACIVASLVWNLHEQDSNLVKLARNTAQVTFENDVLYRRWAAGQGGVYVRATELNPANPYLHVPERDVTTTSGLSLTLVNPAYMARMVNQLAGNTRGSIGHITSLKPIRPANAPDTWEKAALQAFETGVHEVSSVEQLDGREYLRIMRPFLTEQACLKCHAAQGYKVGDIRGGISVSVPMAPLRAVAQTPALKLALAHLGLWLVGLAGIGFSNRALGKHLRAREQAESSLRESQATLRSFYESSPFMMGVAELEGGEVAALYRNSAAAQIFDTMPQRVQESAAATSQASGEIPQLWIERFQQSRCDLAPVRFEYQHPTPSGSHWINATVSFLGESLGPRPRFSFVAENITERKQAEHERQIAMDFLRLMNESHGLQDVIHKAILFFKEQSGCEAVGVRLAKDGDYPYYESRGLAGDFVLAKSSLCSRDAVGQAEHDGAGNPVLSCLCGNIISGRFDPGQPCFTAQGSFWTNSTTQLMAATTVADPQARTRNRCIGDGYESVALISLRSGELGLGLIQLNDRRPERFTPDVIALWERLAGILAATVGRARAQEALRESEERYRLLVEQAVDGIFVSDTRGHYLDVNSAGAAMLGYTPAEIRQLSIADVIAGDEIPRLPLEVARFADGSVISTEWRFRRKDGSFFPGEVVGRQLPNGRLLAILRDITDRKQAEDALRQAHDRMELRVRERTAELSQAVATLHEEVARRSRVEQTLRERSEQMRRLASELTLAEQRERQRLALILHDGLQQVLVGAKFRLALVDRNPSAQHATAEVSELIDDAIEISRSLTAELSPPILLQGDLIAALEWLARWMRRKYDLDVHLKACEKLEPMSEDVIVLLFHATRELLFNVVKHAGVKAAGIQVKRLPDGVQLTVEDKGVGFDPSQLRSEGGSTGGLGLFSIRERLALLGGSMETKSAPGRGSRIKLVAAGLAAAGLADRPSADGKAKVSAAISAPAKAEPGDGEKRIRVLLVDDHMVMRQGLSGLLRAEQGIEIAGEASDGESAVALVRELRPDVVLMDISMPGMDGLQATRIIHKEFPEIRVIGLSLFQESERGAAMLDAGAVSYLAKSGPSEAVIAAIRACAKTRYTVPKTI